MRSTQVVASFALALFAALPLTHWLGTAHAQTARVAEIAGYSGADRTERLIAGAKKEGSLTLYTSHTVADMGLLKSAFEAKYGVKINVWRSNSEDIIQRTTTEYRGGRFEVDAFETDQSGLEALHREKILQRVNSPVIADLVPQASAPGDWLGTRLQIITAAVNTQSIPKADWPKTYEDLLDPKFKGKLAVEAGDADWFATIVTAMGEEKGLKLFRDIVGKNGVSIRKGHTLLATLVSAGEVPLAITTYLFKLEQMQKSGAPIAPVILNPAVARVNGVGLAASAPHPHAAILFMDWLLSDGQAILAANEFFATNKKYAHTPPGLKLEFVNAAEQVDQGPKWQKLFDETFGKKGR
jgi:iron(III) transport system substrate-binding protein